MEWQPIETAPVGTFVLIVFDNANVAVCKLGDDGVWSDTTGYGYLWPQLKPIGWLPSEALPPAPDAAFTKLRRD